MKNLRVILILFSLILSANLKAHESLNAFSGFVSPESVAQDAKGIFMSPKLANSIKTAMEKLLAFQSMENFQHLQAVWMILRV